MWLVLFFSSLSLFFFVSSYYFSCLFYSHIQPLCIITPEWSSPSLNCSFACAWISLSLSRTVCVFKGEFELFPLVQFLLSKSERAGQSKYFNQQWQTHATRPGSPTPFLLSSVCPIYIPRICFVLAHCAYPCCRCCCSLVFSLLFLYVVICCHAWSLSCLILQRLLLPCLRIRHAVQYSEWQQILLSVSTLQ